MVRSTPRALVVDDDMLVRILVARSLSSQWILCDAAEDGALAAKKLEAGHYDIVITDLRMPKRNGHSLCQEILERTDRPLLVVITGLAEPRLIQDLKSRGVDAIFQKPMDFSDFASQIRTMYDERRAATRPAAQREPPVQHEAEIQQPIAEGTPAPEPPRVLTVAILLRERQRARQLASALKSETVSVFVPETMDELYRFVEERNIEVILVEDVTYGFFTGAEILGRIQGSFSVRQAIVLGNADAFRPEQVQSLNIRRIFASDTADTDLIQAVRSALTDCERALANVSPEARALVKSFGSLAHSPAVLFKLSKYLQKPAVEIALDPLAKDIMADPATAAELLRLANSSSFGVRRQITEIAEALTFLGAGRAVALLLSAGIRNIERGLFRRISDDLRGWYQLRTVLIASVASVFAERQFDLSGDMAFVLGLFQDMGTLVLADVFGERYLRLIEQSQTVGPVRLHAIERQYFRVSHAEVSAALVEQWRLPDTLLRPIRLHHDVTLNASDRNDSTSYVLPMRIGEAFADLWDNRHPTRKVAMSQLLAECPHGSYADHKSSLDEAVRKTAEVAQLFLQPAPNEDAALGVCKDILSSYADLCSANPPYVATS